MQKLFNLKNRTGTSILAFALALAALTTFAPAGRGQVSVLTQKMDTNRSGANLSETALNTSNVNVNGFGKLFSCPVDGDIYAQPLYVSNVSIGGGTHNVVYVATAHDSVYAFDADSGTEYWQVSLGTPVPSAVIDTPNIPVEVGITSTPVIDPSTNTIYVCALTYPNSVQTFLLYALDITTGAAKFGSPVTVAAQVSGSGEGGSNGVVPFTATQENQRSGLALANGNVYLTFASHEDYEPYHGWILSYNASTLQQNGVYNDTPNGVMGGIWMAGQAPAVDSSGNLYVMTGNGSSDAQTGGADYGECFVKLSPSLSVLDYFMPNTFASLNAGDEDLGSAGPLLIPGTNEIIGGGKSGILYLLNDASLGKENNSADQVLQEWQAINLTNPGTHHIHGAPVYYNGPSGASIYVWGENDTLHQFAFNGSTFNSTPTSSSTMLAPEINTGMPGGQLSVSANGTNSGTGIVWAMTPTDNDSLHNIVAGTFRAFDASNVAHELFDSRQNQARDDIGAFAKNASPIVANGKVYVATFSHELDVFGLNPPQLTVNRALSVNFVGGSSTNGTPASMASTESAGIVSVGNWNNAAGASGTLSNLNDSAATNSGATVTWQCDGTWSTPITEAAGNARMMKGYLDTPNGASSTTTVTVSNLPSQFTAAPYTVYVYFDGDNGGAWRTGSYTIGSTTIDGIDMGINYGGMFARAVNSEGNYIAFPNITGSSFTLKAVGVDDDIRAPVNGIQVVAFNSGAVSIPSAPTGLAATGGSAVVSLAWNSTAGAAGYNVYRGTTSGGESTTPIATGITGTSYTDTGVTIGSTYYYKVAAVNSAGTSGLSNEASAVPAGASIANATYKIVCEQGGLAVDDPSGGGSGAKIDQQAYGSVDQQWNITLVSGSNYKITSVVNGLALAGPTSSAQLTLQSYTGASDQLWWFKPSGSYYILTNVGTGQVLDDFNNSTTAGTVIGQWAANGGTNQNWTLTRVLAAGTYKLINRLSGLCLEDPNNGGNGTALVQYSYSTQKYQQWKLTPSGTSYSLQCVSNNDAASVNGSKTEGANVLVEPLKSGSSDQLWTITLGSDGYYTLSDNLTGMLMDDSGASTASGSHIIQWDANSGTNQEWSILAP